jgi:hypothetical protein
MPPKFVQPVDEDTEDDRRAPVDAQKREEMLAVLVRNQAAFESVSELLTVGEVRKFSGSMAVVWKVVRRFYKKYSELPTKSQLNAALHDYDTNNPDTLSGEDKEDIDDFVEYAFDAKEHGKNVAKSKSACRVAVETCRRLLEEHVARGFQTALTEDGKLPNDLPGHLQSMQAKLDLVASLSEVKIGVPFPEGWDNRPDKVMLSTGVPTLDDFCGGGYMPDEVFLFMAPYGSCKTTTACHGVSQQVLRAASDYAAGKTRSDKEGNPMKPVVVLIFTESNIDEYRNRILSHLARIMWTRMGKMRRLSDMCDSKKPGSVAGETEYELAEFASEIKDKLPWENEQERIANAVAVCNEHLLLIDCTDSEDSPHKIGRGGIVEIANVMRNVFRERPNCYPHAFWLDHVSGLVDRMADDIKDEAHLRRILTNVPRLAADKLAKPFKAPVMLFHQLSGEANSRSAVAKFHHADAEGSKSIAKYANFAFVSGPTDDALLCQWECTKHRREPPTKTRIVRVLGMFNRLVDETEDYGVEAGRRMIMKKSEMVGHSSTKSAVVDNKAKKGKKDISTASHM